MFKTRSHPGTLFPRNILPDKRKTYLGSWALAEARDYYVRENRTRQAPVKLVPDSQGVQSPTKQTPGAHGSHSAQSVLSTDSTPCSRSPILEREVPRSLEQSSGSDAHLDALVVTVPGAAEAGEAAQVTGGPRPGRFLWRSCGIW